MRVPQEVSSINSKCSRDVVVVADGFNAQLGYSAETTAHRRGIFGCTPVDSDRGLAHPRFCLRQFSGRAGKKIRSPVQLNPDCHRQLQFQSEFLTRFLSQRNA